MIASILLLINNMSVEQEKVVYQMNLLGFKQSFKDKITNENDRSIRNISNNFKNQSKVARGKSQTKMEWDCYHVQNQFQSYLYDYSQIAKDKQNISKSLNRLNKASDIILKERDKKMTQIKNNIENIQTQVKIMQDQERGQVLTKISELKYQRSQLFYQLHSQRKKYSLLLQQKQKFIQFMHQSSQELQENKRSMQQQCIKICQKIEKAVEQNLILKSQLDRSESRINYIRSQSIAYQSSQLDNLLQMSNNSKCWRTFSQQKKDQELLEGLDWQNDQRLQSKAQHQIKQNQQLHLRQMSLVRQLYEMELKRLKQRQAQILQKLNQINQSKHIQQRVKTTNLFSCVSNGCSSSQGQAFQDKLIKYIEQENRLNLMDEINEQSIGEETRSQFTRHHFKFYMQNFNQALNQDKTRNSFQFPTYQQEQQQETDKKHLQNKEIYDESQLINDQFEQSTAIQFNIDKPKPDFSILKQDSIFSLDSLELVSNYQETQYLIDQQKTQHNKKLRYWNKFACGIISGSLLSFIAIILKSKK